MRNLEALAVFAFEALGKETHFPRNYAEARRVIFLTVIKKDLQAYANSKDGDAGLKSFFEYKVKLQSFQIIHGAPRRAYSREDNPFRLPYFLVRIGDATGKTEMAQGSFNTGKISGPIIQNGDHKRLLSHSNRKRTCVENVKVSVFGYRVKEQQCFRNIKPDP
jgi:hypothetical protein